MLIVILCSSITLALEKPPRADPTSIFEENVALGVLEVVYAVVFITEIVLKVSWSAASELLVLVS